MSNDHEHNFIEVMDDVESNRSAWWCSICGTVEVKDHGFSEDGVFYVEPSTAIYEVGKTEPTIVGPAPEPVKED